MALTVLSVAYPFAPVGRDAVGGAEQVLTALDRGLVDKGHRSVVVACEGSAVAGELVVTPRHAGIVEEAARRRAWAAHRQAIQTVLARAPVDIVHLHGIDCVNYLPQAAPTLATLHLPLDWYPQEIYEPRPNLWLNCVSAAQHDSRPEKGRFLAPVPNGVSPALFGTRQRKRGHAMMLARICPEKGVHLALQACHAADVPLLIGGQIFAYEAHEAYFRDEVAPLLDRKRRFLGPLGFERKRRLLAAARCALVPSLVAETSSLAGIEALACGTPVIAFGNGALAELVEHGVTGFIVSDVDGMARAIKAADDIDPERCRAAAAERFSMAAMVEGYLGLYAAILAEHAIPVTGDTGQSRRAAAV